MLPLFIATSIILVYYIISNLLQAYIYCTFNFKAYNLNSKIPLYKYSLPHPAYLFVLLLETNTVLVKISCWVTLEGIFDLMGSEWTRDSWIFTFHQVLGKDSCGEGQAQPQLSGYCPTLLQVSSDNGIF